MTRGRGVRGVAAAPVRHRVLPAAQGRGIGTRLLALVEDHARSLGLSEIRLYANEAMTENLAYYLRHGYAETHRAEQDGFHRVFFRKPSTDYLLAA